MPLSPTSWPSGGSSSGGALALLYQLTRGTDGTFDQASIPATYNDLVIVAIIRSTNAGNADNPGIRFNNDSGANYFAQTVQANAATASGTERIAQTGLLLGRIPAAAATGNAFGIFEMAIFGYASTSRLKAFSWASYDLETLLTGGQNGYAGGGLWNSTAAINRLLVASGTFGNLLTGSELRIYGRL